MTTPPPIPTNPDPLSPPVIAERDDEVGDAISAPRRRSFSLPGWLVSMIVHLLGLIIIGTLTVPAAQRYTQFFVALPSSQDADQLELLPLDFEVSEIPVDEVGALPDMDQLAATALAPELVDVPEVEAPETPTINPNPLQTRDAIDIATGTDFSKTFIVKGQAGVGLQAASGAIDRLTHELLLSMEERPTLVAWLFDQSGSLNRQRREIKSRFRRIYDEIGTVTATGVFDRFAEEPLLSLVVAFGQQVSLRTPKPTANPDVLRQAVARIEEDTSGVENVFQAINLVIDEFRRYRRQRNILIVVFSDEVGDDQQLLDETVDNCRQLEIPVYVVGVPAPFGQAETLVKWVDPNPKYNQQPQWGRVNQGPESLVPERIQLAFADAGDVEPPIDSGFGPYALTRLCYQTGGIYFAVHPNRRTDRRLRVQETAAFSAFFRRFFDQQAMRRYRPEYVSAHEYQRTVEQLASRTALVAAARQSHIEPLVNPRQRFSARTAAEFAANLTDGQKAAAKLEPKLLELYDTLARGERARQQEQAPRWQAGFDLAMGRTLAALVRTQNYNTILADAKRGLTAKDPQTNTWLLRTAHEVTTNSQLERKAEQARQYLDRVIDEHPGTPWAYLAERELRLPLGWEWHETYVQPPEERRARLAQNNNRSPRDDQRRMLARPKPRREVPRL